MKVAKEMNLEYAIVSYDLAVALKAYSIQSLQSPMFDKLIILLGNFHLEMAFFGALGTFIAEDGIEYLLTESDILASGSVQGFLKGKFYNRCTRIHQIAATLMKRNLCTKFRESLSEEEKFIFARSCHQLLNGSTKHMRRACRHTASCDNGAETAFKFTQFHLLNAFAE